MASTLTPPGGRTGEVVSVVDGDAMDVVCPGGAPIRVRLLGVDTPDAQDQSQPHKYGDIAETVTSTIGSTRRQLEGP